MLKVKQNKIFIVAGELSGDRVAAWYIARLQTVANNSYFEAVGGDFLQEQGVTLFKRFESLNVVGIVEIIKHIPRLLNTLNILVDHILTNNFQEVILVDFPGFNLRLARYLKQRNKTIKITYLSPPQLWCWGQWRIKTLQRFCDDLVVLYPFEVAWYQARGLQVRWVGSPVYDSLKKYFIGTEEKKQMIALLIGSRLSEVVAFVPIIGAVARRLIARDRAIKFLVPLARSLPDNYVEDSLRQSGFGDILDRFIFVRDEHEKFMLLRECRVALTKPGTVTLELALLNIPSLVFFKTSWFTYYIARLLVHVSYMALPNLLLNKTVFKEFIQGDCSIDIVCNELHDMYKQSLELDRVYLNCIADCQLLRKMLQIS